MSRTLTLGCSKIGGARPPRYQDARVYNISFLILGMGVPHEVHPSTNYPGFVRFRSTSITPENPDAMLQIVKKWEQV